MLTRQEDIAKLKDRKYEIEIESKHFFEYVDDTGADYDAIKIRGKISSDRVMQLWQELQNRANQDKPLSLFAKLRSIFVYGIADWNFYNNDLVIMTEDDELNKSLMAIKTAEGNHRRGNYNQRQIDIIKEEILPKLDVPSEEIGIIAPYNDQVDDQIKDFTDDPYLLNVAVSRAKKRLIVVVSGNKQEKEGNIIDLISYIQYNKLEVIDSQIFSVFDYLYEQYRDKKKNHILESCGLPLLRLNTNGSHEKERIIAKLNE